MKTPLQIFNERFDRPHEPRSKPYKEGVLYILCLKAGEIERQACWYPIGSAEADAFFAGMDEGLLMWRIAEPPLKAYAVGVEA
ncbi:hypothetical protein [Nitrincola iocasae]|uniref:Uncharacterized protein n=1 Tax=Nitrincola iocasae TaxID=2614693 RepID=A0A5J6LBH9_9GAMM|nr:hypothetical protein [Nitrincola iocasae]QEW05628.1 hypothetical protein F5I99_03510 [Nitrincola iocasae]